jgi:hypothetical protein
MAMEAEQTGQLPIERAWPKKKEFFFSFLILNKAPPHVLPL